MLKWELGWVYFDWTVGKERRKSNVIAVPVMDWGKDWKQVTSYETTLIV